MLKHTHPNDVVPAILIVMIGLVAVIIGMTYALHPGRDSLSSAFSVPSQEAVKDDTESFLKAGEKAYAVADDVPAFLSETAGENGHKYLRADDLRGVAEMVAEGRAVLLPRGTALKILDHAVFSDRINARVLDGDSAGKEVWLERVHLKR